MTHLFPEINLTLLENAEQDAGKVILFCLATAVQIAEIHNRSDLIEKFSKYQLEVPKH
jgi:hypothetical protein